MVYKNIDLKIWESNYVTLYAQQGEVDSRYIKVSFKDNDLNNLDLTGKTVTIYAKKPDNTQIFNTCTINEDDNTATVKLTSQFLSSEGIVECEFQIFEGSKILLKVNGLKIIVFCAEDFSYAIESTSEYNALLKSIEQAQTFADNTGDVSNLNTVNKSSIVGAINELVGNEGDITNLNTANKTSLVAAVNELKGNEGNITGLNTSNKESIVDAVNELVSNIGSITTLETTNKSSIISAVNEVVSSIGNTSGLSTTNKDSIVSAVNELVSNSGSITNLNTSNKTSLVAAINEVSNNAGSITNLDTVDKSSIVAAINELSGRTIPLTHGGTGATTAAAARTNLEVMKAYVLYSNDAENCGTITLNDDADNYEFLDVILWDFYLTRVYNRNNRPVGIMKIGGYGSNYFEWFSESVTISSNVITRNGVTHGLLLADGSVQIDNTNHVPIRAIIGYKY